MKIEIDEDSLIQMETLARKIMQACHKSRAAAPGRVSAPRKGLSDKDKSRILRNAERTRQRQKK